MDPFNGDPFSIIEETPDKRLYDKFEELTSAKSADHDVQYQSALRERFPELSLTCIPMNSCNLLAFANAGHAQADYDQSTDPIARWRSWIPSYGRGGKAGIGQTIFFAKFHYTWSGEDFIIYVVGGVQYVLKEPQDDESVKMPSKVTDKLIAACGTWQSADKDIIYVYDNYWRRDKALWEQVAKAKWENVILDEAMKKDLTEVSNKFFDNESVYKDLGVPWKRGLIFYGPAGNGKTISIKALMRTLRDRHPSVPSLYVKSAPNTYNIGQVFTFARLCAPCMLVFEDIETIIRDNTRSYFLNEVDGLSSNDGILMVATTNFLERLDPGLTKRPSRFDRKYLFPLPNEHERTLYAEYWRNKLQHKDSKRVKVDFPERLCPAMAKITSGFSFAYMQEAFVSSLLEIARDMTIAVDDPVSVQQQPDFSTTATATFRPNYQRSAASQALYNNLRPQRSGQSKDDNADLDEYKLWRIFSEQVRVLRGDMDDEQSSSWQQAVARQPRSLPVFNGASRFVAPSEKSPFPSFSQTSAESKRSAMDDFLDNQQTVFQDSQTDLEANMLAGDLERCSFGVTPRLPHAEMDSPAFGSGGGKWAVPNPAGLSWVLSGGPAQRGFAG